MTTYLGRAGVQTQGSYVSTADPHPTDSVPPSQAPLTADLLSHPGHPPEPVPRSARPHVILDVEKALEKLEYARREFCTAVQVAIETAGWLEGLGRKREAEELLLRTLTLGWGSGAFGQKPRASSAPPEADSRSGCNQLSPRECEILRLVCSGNSNKEIAKLLTITPETVKAHVKRIFAKLEVSSRAAAAYRASALGLI